MFTGLGGATLTADLGSTQLYTRGDRRFAKFFLISDQVNLKNWHVTPESIPKRLQTFIGRPFISEPGLAHFGTDDLPIDQVLKKQEDYRAGDIVDVQYNESAGVATAIVEFLDTKLSNQVWKELKQGKAIYVSPAVAGISGMTPQNTRLFIDWFGLHLARVDQPAYGVLHASIKQTCEGPEKDCIKQLVASAGLDISSFNISSSSTCQMNGVPGTTPEPTMKDVLTAVANLDKKFSEQFETVNNDILKIKSAADVSPEAKGKTITPDPLSDKEKQAGTLVDDIDRGPDTRGSSAANDGKNGTTDSKKKDGDDDDDMAAASMKEVETLKTMVASLENKEKARVVEDILALKASASLYQSQKEIDTERTTLMAKPLAALEEKLTETQTLVQQVLKSQPQGMQTPDNGARIVVQSPAIASAAMDDKPGPRSIADIRKMGLMN